MNAATEIESTPSLPELCTVVVIYDDAHTRNRALTACDYLVSQIWEAVELDFHWWRTDFLKDPHMAGIAAQHAVASDFLIVCLNTTDEVSANLEMWFESWIDQRGSRQGAMIDLTAPTATGVSGPHRQAFLHTIARRGMFDHLTAVPEQLEVKSPGTSKRLDTKKLPATEEPSWHSRPPPRFGLNE